MPCPLFKETKAMPLVCSVMPTQPLAKYTFKEHSCKRTHRVHALPLCRPPYR